MTGTKTEHPARAAGLASQAAVRARDKDAWLALFAEDGIVEDPIGPSGFDPEGKGHRGRDAIAAFWDKAIAQTESIEFLFDDSFACGAEVAFTGTIRSRLGGHQIDADGVFTYRVDGAGKIAALRAFWEVDRAMATARRVD
ncbi:nuclear transport factor 2 family protein [Nocardia puris]|uniref:SnoaL-like protein n=1 Tax=Nocardia puris TaxID=208602 RepID=A0A366DBQ4_9NOCA|nr:nuclear transport factor 2 family protein [Nocardia puris]MBF6211870.1 nuclear transport factor 2 family protein [Nocardia puris]MBF6365873.1 nuclear transport factor 2 family protein [Nocardia puris]MBF6460484.1 nuclear transport factor 2 family protein [Nocardia puris]RBO87487.1 SnoaL-like protein [Nocardia puris]